MRDKVFNSLLLIGYQKTFTVGKQVFIRNRSSIQTYHNFLVYLDFFLNLFIKAQNKNKELICMYMLTNTKL